MREEVRNSWVLRGRRVVLPEGIRPASIVTSGGVIQRVGEFDVPFDEDAGELTIMPGLVDTHVHINEPGRAHWEGFDSASRSASAGGITTIVEMPLNSIPATTSVPALKEKINAATRQCHVDVGFWGGVVPGNQAELEPLSCSGCLGFKCFLAPSGVEEFEHVKEADLRKAMIELARLDAVLLAHAELEEYLRPLPASAPKYLEYMNTRPAAAEIAAIELLLNLCRETGCRTHIVHLSAAGGLEILERGRTNHLPITVETCPHYLATSAEQIADGATEFKCAPPIREAGNREALWTGLQSGQIDMIVSDHSPCPTEMKCRKSGNFSAAWGGIASLQLMLPVVWTEASKRGFNEGDIARWMSLEPAKLAGLSFKKGAIAAGHDADFVIWDPHEEFVVEPESLLQRWKITPYTGRRLRGVVKKTYLHGRPVTKDSRPRGRILLKAQNLSRHAAPRTAEVFVA